MLYNSNWHSSLHSPRERDIGCTVVVVMLIRLGRVIQRVHHYPGLLVKCVQKLLLLRFRLPEDMNSTHCCVLFAEPLMITRDSWRSVGCI